jgi:hypothetical protein
LKQLGGFQTPSKILKNHGFLLKKYLKNFLVILGRDFGDEKTEL